MINLQTYRCLIQLTHLLHSILTPLHALALPQGSAYAIYIIVVVLASFICFSICFSTCYEANRTIDSK